MVYWRIFGARKKKNKSADVIWRWFDAMNKNAHWSLVIVQRVIADEGKARVHVLSTRGRSH